MNRRAEVAQESDFKSMDGASKLFGGDAVAGILILFINIFGGLIVGTAQNGLSLEQATEIYVLLTIGDGLVAQIPALLLSLSTAIVVAMVTTTESVGEQASRSFQRILARVGSNLTGLGLIPRLIVFHSRINSFAGRLFQQLTNETPLSTTVRIQRRA